MKVKLNSEFHDCYDHFFDLDGDVIFTRRMDSGPNRIEMMKILNAAGIKTPKFGMVAELYKDLASHFDEGKDGMRATKYDQLVEMVVYTDIVTHAGEGKVKLTLEEAKAQYPGHFATQYIPPSTDIYKGRTERLLSIGDRQFWFEFLSKDDWRSNCGDVQITPLLAVSHSINELQIPLYAIDFVTVGHERLAIDLNVSPGVRGMGLKLKPEEIAKLIKDKMARILNICTW
jgi:hypothetical protein